MRGSPALVAVVTCLALWAACGGKATLDAEDGSGGSASSSSASSTTTVGPGPSTATTAAGGNTPCRLACSDLYDCGLEGDVDGMQLCPGFTGSAAQKNSFMFGGGPSGGCVAACDAEPVIASLVDPDDCAGTIADFKGLEPEFADVCDNGL
jgi:hypothetical protein